MKNQQEIATPNIRKIADSDIAPDKSCKEKHKSLSATKRITYLATLTALSLLLKAISNNVSAALPPTLKISLSYLGWYISAAIMGPFGGGVVAAVTDILGQFMTVNFAPPNPVLVAGNFMATVVFGILFRKLPFKNVTVRAVVAVTASLIVGTLGLNSIGLYYMYYDGINYLVYLVSYRLTQLPMAYLNMVIMLLLLPTCRRIGLIDEDYRGPKER